MSSPRLESLKGPPSVKVSAKRAKDDEKEENESKKSKLTSNSKPSTPMSSKTVSIKLGTPITPKSSVAKPAVSLKKTCVFGDSDDDEEVEEMPAEARMRMKNIGRDTQTSAGPNSFGKTRQGFCNSKKVFEKQLKQAMEENLEK